MRNQTQAAILTRLGQPLELWELELPPLRPGQVLVDIVYSGVCHTQVLEARGRRGPDRYLPHCLGHEGVGVVAEVGPEVTKVKPGDRVVLTWIRGNGADVPSMVYPSARGPVNSGAVCTFMRRTVTCESRVVAIGTYLPWHLAALLGCAVPTGAGAVLNTARVEAGQRVAVFGVGGVGAAAVMAAAMAGAAEVIAVDVVVAKLEAAVALGATSTINAAVTDPVAVLHDTRGGVDVAIESAGRTESMEAAFASVRERGGLCVLAGNLPHGGRLSVDPFDLIRGRRLVGCWGGDTQPDADLPRYATDYALGRLPLDKLATREYALDAINEAVDDLEAGRVGRPLIRMGRSEVAP